MTYDIAIENLADRIPAHWKVVPFRHLATLINSANVGSSAPLLSLASSGIVAPRKEFDGLGRQMPADGTIERYWLTMPGDLVVNPMWLVGGGIGVSQVRGAVSPDYRVYRLCADLDPRYVHHLLRSQPYRDQYQLYTRAETTFDRRVSKVDFHAMPILVPPLNEQRRIADFLDGEMARIDQMSVLRGSVVEMLGQRDTAVRDAMIDSLINEVGELPLRRYTPRIDQGSSPPCESRPREGNRWGVLKLSAVKSGLFYPEENKELPHDVEPIRQYEVRDGDLLVSRANTPELVGDVAVVKGAGRGLLLPDLIYRVGLGREIEADFAAQAFLSTRVRGLVQATARGSSQSMVKLRGEDIREWPVPQANIRQQRAIVTALSVQLESSDRLRAAVNRQLGLLAERKQALITAAVTGQIDVTTARGAAV